MMVRNMQARAQHRFEPLEWAMAATRNISRLLVRVLFVSAAVAWSTLRTIWSLLRWGGRVVVIVVMIIVLVFLAQTVAFTPRDVAYRHATPDSKACHTQTRAKAVLAERGIDNDELSARRAYPELADALTCMLQEHEVPVPSDAHWPNGAAMGSIRFHLAFLEFLQDGRPAEFGPRREPVKESQLDVLLKHLKAVGEKKQNYVIVFIHGWRHDASIGDDNVRDLRSFASHAASFLDFRCKTVGRYCNSVVTAVYLGWRGARVHESELREKLGERLGKVLGTVLAAPTLFDRKPVSERIGPAAVSALGQIDAVLEANNKTRPSSVDYDRLLTIGHSLGGNMLAVALKDTMIAKIRRHPQGTVMTAPFGDLIVLLNPASEAYNWTAIQRTMRERIAFEGAEEDLIAGHRFFRRDQRPIYIALTSAYRWPVADIREEDKKSPDIVAAIRRKNSEFRTRVDYDWATHDLFPAFKGDLRPWARTWEDTAQYYRNGGADRAGAAAAETDACSNAGSMRNACRSSLVYVFRGLAAVARNIPFMNTSSEETRAIGHYDPLRPPYGRLNQWKRAATDYGTTHELIVNQEYVDGTKYTNAALPHLSECAVVDHWLWEARNDAAPHGTGWDSGYTQFTRYGELVGTRPRARIPIRPRTSANLGHLEIQIRHGHLHGGIAPIVRANDPFWNVRAFDTALKEHDGYVSYPLICAINQLVMDDVASARNPSVAEAPEPMASTPMPAPAGSQVGR
jgi:hypothetical protein